MKPVSPEEISALFDGELTRERAEEVRRAIGEDERLRQIYEETAETDVALKSLAFECQFEPRIAVPGNSPELGFPVYAIALVVLIARVLAKVMPFGPGVLLQVLVTGLVAAWLLCRFLPRMQADRWQVVREIGLGCGIAVSQDGQSR